MTSWITRASGKLFTMPAMEGSRSCSTGTEPPSIIGEDPDPLGEGDHDCCPIHEQEEELDYSESETVAPARPGRCDASRPGRHGSAGSAPGWREPVVPTLV